jgi:hypothetical protein
VRGAGIDFAGAVRKSDFALNPRLSHPIAIIKHL